MTLRVIYETKDTYILRETKVHHFLIGSCRLGPYSIVSTVALARDPMMMESRNNDHTVVVSFQIAESETPVILTSLFNVKGRHQIY
jgi:hypothetical protein